MVAGKQLWPHLHMTRARWPLVSSCALAKATLEGSKTCQTHELHRVRDGQHTPHQGSDMSMWPFNARPVILRKQRKVEPQLPRLASERPIMFYPTTCEGNLG